MKEILTAFVILLVAFSNSHAEKTLIFSKPNDPVADLSETVLRKAYERLGISIQTQTHPAERSLALSNKGAVDGEVNRIKKIESIYPNLIRVPVAINVIEGVVFAKTKTFPVQGWKSLSPYKIGIRRGTKFAELGTKGMMVEPVNENDQLFKLLNIGRTDVVVTSRIEGLEQITTMKLPGIRILEPPLVTLELFHFLHKDHKDLLSGITTVLKSMSDSGQIKAIRLKAIYSTKPLK